MEPRAINLAELRQIQESDDKDALILSLAYDIPLASAQAWLETATAGAALARINAAWDKANATEDAGFPVAAANDAVVAREAE